MHASLPQRRTAPPLRRGLTLMELLLVLAVLALFAALAVPAMRSTLDNRRLHIAAEALRGAWAKARVEAMKSGRIQGFRFEEGGERYRVQPFFASDDALEAPPVDQFSLSPYVVVEADADKRLAEGVRFIAAQTHIERRGERAMAAMTDDDRLSLGGVHRWSDPILFYPDGSTSPASIVLANRRGRMIEVTLRGLTGTSRVGEVFLDAEFLPGGAPLAEDLP